jgi:hypothetical protein
LFGDFDAEVSRDDVFKPIIENESPHEIGNGNGFGVVNFTTSKNLFVISITFPDHNIYKYNWISPDG